MHAVFHEIPIKGVDPTGRISLQNSGFLNFLGQKSSYMYRSTWNLARRRRFVVSSDVPDLAVIGRKCRPCVAKKRTITPLVLLIPAFLPVIERWNYFKLISAADIISKLFQPNQHVEKYSWAAINLQSNLETILGTIISDGHRWRLE